MIHKIIILFALTFGPLSNVFAADGNTLLKRCTSGMKFMETGVADNPVDVGYCAGFINGVGAMLGSSSRNGPPQSRACIPETAPIKQLVRVVYKYLESNPADLHEEEGLLTVKALAQSFPCPGK